MTKLKWLLISAALALSSVAHASILNGFSDVFVFGDSVSDTGNVFFATGETVTAPFGGLIPSRPYTISQRFSNGPIWTDQLGLTASLVGGTSYAFGGARTGPLPLTTAPPADAPPTLLQQVNDFFLPDVFVPSVGPVAPSDALYVLAPVGNDVREAAIESQIAFDQTFTMTRDLALAEAAAQAKAADVIEASLTNVATIIGTLDLFGAEQFLMFNSANLGLTPVAAALGSTIAPQLTNLSLAYNAGLSEVLLMFPDLEFFELDLFALQTNAVGDLTNANSCVTPTAVCSNPEDFFFWDGLHPTTTAHTIIANAIRTAVPEPATLALLGVGLAGFAFGRKRTAHR